MLPYNLYLHVVQSSPEVWEQGRLRFRYIFLCTEPRSAISQAIL